MWSNRGVDSGTGLTRNLYSTRGFARGDFSAAKGLGWSAKLFPGVPMQRSSAVRAVVILRSGMPRLAALLLLVIALTTLNAGQAGGQNWLLVARVVDRASGEPIFGAEVRVGRARGVTDEVGLVSLSLPPVDTAVAVVGRLGYLERRVSIKPTASGRTEITVSLESEALKMEELGVAARVERRSPALQRFDARVGRGKGVFVTRKDIERARPRRLSDLFRLIPGVRIEPTAHGDKLQMTGAIPVLYSSIARDRGDCPVQYYLEGVHFQPSSPGIISNDIRPDEVEGVEIYRRLAEVPSQYRRPGAECGVIAIWRRDSL